MTNTGEQGGGGGVDGTAARDGGAAVGGSRKGSVGSTGGESEGSGSGLGPGPDDDDFDMGWERKVESANASPEGGSKGAPEDLVEEEEDSGTGDSSGALGSVDQSQERPCISIRVTVQGTGDAEKEHSMVVCWAAQSRASAPSSSDATATAEQQTVVCPAEEWEDRVKGAVEAASAGLGKGSGEGE